MKRKSNFLKYFGESPRIKVLDTLIENEMFDLSMQEISELSGVSRVTLMKLIPELLKQKIIIKTREVGRATMYRLNSKSDFVQRLFLMDEALNLQSIKKELKKEKVTA
jgi:DNA-binding transcriptional ArsR family regulator